MELKFKKVYEDAQAPTFGTSEAACFDLYVYEDTVLEPMRGTLVKTGLAFDTPKGYCIKIYLRSSMCKKGIVASTGVVDSDYRNEVRVQAINLNLKPVYIKKGERIGQAKIEKLEDVQLIEVDKLSETERKGGFGSTGV